MWIFCCGPVRSGSTLHFNLTREIVENSKSGFAVEYVYPKDFPNVYAKYSQYECLKIFKTHEVTPFMKDLINMEPVKFIYCYRDIRDVVVSIEHKAKREIKPDSDYSKLTKKYIHYYNEMKTMDDVYISKYENFYSNIFQEASKICKYLSIELANDVIDDISDKLHFIKSSKYIAEIEKEEFIGINGQVFKLDPRTMLHHNHFKHIHPEAYKEFLYGKNLESIEKNAYSWLRKNGYKIDYFKFLKYRLLNYL